MGGQELETTVETTFKSFAGKGSSSWKGKW